MPENLKINPSPSFGKFLKITGSSKDIKHFRNKLKEKNGDDLIVTGDLSEIDEKSDYQLFGTYIDHPKYGIQFKVSGINKELPNTELYNTIYIGFPIWWGVAPRIINTFIENSKLKDKDIVIFATSGGSGIDYALNDLKKHYPELRIIGGKLINKNISEDII